MAVATSQNSPKVMYKLNPYYGSEGNVELPDCMYNHKTYYTDSGDGSSNSDEQKALSPELINLEKRQDAILKRLEALKEEVFQLSSSVSSSPANHPACSSTAATQSLGPAIHDIVINANPDHPPLSLFVLYEQLQQHYRVLPKVHVHSSVSDRAGNLTSAFGENGTKVTERSDCQIVLTLIWKDVKNGPELKVNTSVQTPVLGEGAVVRYLARLLNPPYDGGDPVTATEIDSWIDMSCQQILRGNKKEKAAALKSMNSRLGKSDWLVGSSMSLADVVAWSSVSQSQQVKSSPDNVKKWYERCSKNCSFRTATDLCKLINL